MDWSQWRRTTAIDTGPLADLQDKYYSTGFGKAVNEAGAAIGDAWDSAFNDKYAQGGLADQAGANDIDVYGTNQADNENTGFGVGQGGDYSFNPYEGGDTGDYGYAGGDNGDYGYAEGGAVNDDTDDSGRAIPKGAAADPSTSGLASALQIVDDVMQHGYKINGLTGQSQQMPNQPTAPAFAIGGNVPMLSAPKVGYTQPGYNYNYNQPGNPQFQAIPGAASSGMAVAQRVGNTRGRGLSYPSQPRMPTMPSTSGSDLGHSTNMPTNPGIQNPGQSGGVGGTRIDPNSYTGHRFDDGGAIEDDQPAIPDQTGQPPVQTDQGDPNGGWQGGIPTMDNARQAMRGMPSPAAPFEAPIKRILNLIQGGGSMPIPQAQQLEHASGESDPNMAKIKTAATLAKNHGPDAAWSYMQALRKQYDLNRTNAAVKATQGNIPQSTIAATNAMQNVLDGTSVHFSPARGGVRVQVKRLGPGQSKRYDDGGEVDANGNDAAPAIPDQAGGDQVSNALSSIGSTIADTVMSIPQYLQLLRGRIGQYDEVWNNGLVKALTEGGPDNTHQFPTPPQSSAALGEGAEGGAPMGVPEQGGKIGTEEEDPQELRREVPLPRSRPQQEAPEGEAEGPKAAAPVSGKGAPPPTGPESMYEKLVRLYGQDEVDRAQAEFPAASQFNQMMASLHGVAEESTKHEHEMEKQEKIWGTKEKIADLVGRNRITVQDMKDKLGNAQEAARTARAVQVAAMKIGGQQMSDLSKRFNSFVNAGNIRAMPPELMEWGTKIINQAAATEEARPRGPLQVQTQGNPNEAPQSQQRVVLVNNKPYYVDAGGKVLGPATGQ